MLRRYILPIFAILLMALPLPAATESEYVVTLDPVATIDGVETIARRLAATYGGTVVETAGEKFVIRLASSRARLLAADTSVQSIHAVASEAAAAVETVNWTGGVAYAYDGSGNIRQIGNDRFAYDSASRLVRSDINNVRRDFEYDAAGNRTRCTQAQGDCQMGVTIRTSDNRIEQAGYDGSGNVASMNGHTYAYDAVNMLTRDSFGSSVREFIYTAGDERLATYSTAGATWRWTVRDAAGNVLREFTSSGPGGTGAWQWTKDYVWRDGLLLASQQPERGLLEPTRYHYHLDHLGTPRRITNQRDRIVGVHDYHTFGPEVPGGTDEPSPTPIKYTGHERDDGGLDYMHARYYAADIGRFLSIDPAMDIDAILPQPQLWNRYSYGLNNPLKFIDPSGTTLIVAPNGQQTILDMAGNAAARISFEKDGTVDTSQLTEDDLLNNEAALLLHEMATSHKLYTYEESTTIQTQGGPQKVDGVINLDQQPKNIAGVNKKPAGLPPRGVDAAISIHPQAQWVDDATGKLPVARRAVAFHELAEAYAKVEQNIPRGPDAGPGGHIEAVRREQIMLFQWPSFTQFPAGGRLRRK